TARQEPRPPNSPELLPKPVAPAGATKQKGRPRFSVALSLPPDSHAVALLQAIRNLAGLFEMFPDVRRCFAKQRLEIFILRLAHPLFTGFQGLLVIGDDHSHVLAVVRC